MSAKKLNRRIIPLEIGSILEMDTAAAASKKTRANFVKWLIKAISQKPVKIGKVEVFPSRRVLSYGKGLVYVDISGDYLETLRKVAKDKREHEDDSLNNLLSFCVSFTNRG